MPETTLTCLSDEDAQIVATEANKGGDPAHWSIATGRTVTLTYHDKRYPLDVADWAFNAGHASDAETANTIARL